MKQNERLLVYAVTGFLALILVVAVLFSREPGKDGKVPGTSQGLDQILGQDVAGKAAGDDKVGKEKAGLDANRAGLPSPGDIAPPQPLAAGASKPMLAADLVAQQLGPSLRQRNVRLVRARQNDTLEGLVRRWCGARDPYFAETKSLNEELQVLRVGQEVAVPWVDDEVLVAAIEAQKPKLLTAQDAVAGGATPASGTPAPASSPSFAEPGGNNLAGGNLAGNLDGGRTGPRAPGTGTPYTVKDRDSLWKIAERTYGRKNADRMIPVIKEANPGLSENLHPGQKIVLPPAATPAGT